MLKLSLDSTSYQALGGGGGGANHECWKEVEQ